MAKWAAVTVCVVLGVSSVQTQEAPSRGPEVAELGYYVGSWSTTGESRGSADEAFGELTGEETCEWFGGGTSVVCRESMTDRNGTSDSLYILAWDAAEKQYTVYGTDHHGAIYTGTGILDEGVWRWTAEVHMQGTVTPARYTFHAGPEGSRTMDIELATGEETWLKIIHATYRPAM